MDLQQQSMQPLTEPLMTQEEVAEMFGVTIHAVRKWRKWGWIEFIRVGKTVRFEREHVTTFMERHTKVPA